MNKCCLRFLLLFGTLMAGCGPAPSPCPASTLILDEELFPTGTYAEPLESPLPEYPHDGAARTFYYAPDSVFQEVIAWGSSGAAKRQFDLHLQSAFDTDQYMGPWAAPAGLHTSLTASNYYAACGTDLGIYQCRMVATYGEFSVFFRGEMSGNAFTFADLNRLLEAIDGRMTACAALR